MIWRASHHTLDLSHRALIMGILNVTPDSFSDGGALPDADAAVARAEQMIAEGADIIDVGGESTRPGAQPVSEQEEMARVLPVIERIRGAIISIDTSKAAVAEAALAAGASIINDVTALRGDPRMAQVALESQAGTVLMHMQGSPRDMQDAPRYDDVTAEVGEFFRQALARAVACGLDPERIALDPGIGFGKTAAHNLQLIRDLEKVRRSGRPIVLGVSRKSFMAKITGATDIDSRLAPTLALTALGRARGAGVLRVHDVAENVRALRITEAVLGA